MPGFEPSQHLEQRAMTALAATQTTTLIGVHVMSRLFRSLRLNPQRWLAVALLPFVLPSFFLGPWTAGVELQSGHIRIGWFFSALVLVVFALWLSAPLLESRLPTKLARFAGPVFKTRRRLRSRKASLLMKEVLVSVMKMGLYRNSHNVPRMVKLSRTATPGITRADFVVPRNFADVDLLREMDVYQSALNLVRTTPLDDDPRAGFVTVLLCEVDPLEAHLDGLSAPVFHMTKEQECDPFHWLPVGIDSNGQPLERPMFLEEVGSVRSLTSGGSGTGKSSIFVQQLLQSVLNPNIDVLIMDNKGSEFFMFAPYVRHYGTTVEDFWEQIQILENEVKMRSLVLREAGDTQWSLKHGNFIRWSMDELVLLISRLDTGKGPGSVNDFNSRIGGITSVGRSLGIGVDFSSQTWKSGVLPTEIRDVHFNLKTGFRADTLQESVYLGFTSEDMVRPDLIRGNLLKSGRDSSAGQFATTGLGAATYGKSYYLDPKKHLIPFLEQRFGASQVEQDETEVVF